MLSKRTASLIMIVIVLAVVAALTIWFSGR